MNMLSWIIPRLTLCATRVNWRLACFDGQNDRSAGAGICRQAHSLSPLLLIDAHVLRQVNDAYRGTLSSYGYVLMCIHLLQQRQPPVLPCLHTIRPHTHVRCAILSHRLFPAHGHYISLLAMSAPC